MIGSTTFWIIYIIAGISIWFLIERKVGRSSKEFFKFYTLIGAFALGYNFDVSLSTIVFKRGTKGFSWKNIIDYIYLGLMAVMTVILGKKLMKKPSMSFIGSLFISFVLGSLIRSMVTVIN